MSHVKSRSNVGDEGEFSREYASEFPRHRRTGRNKPSGIDASSLATVRELLREIRRLEQEVDHLSYDNEDLLSRMETLLTENEALRRQCHPRSGVAPEGRFKATPKSSTRRTWEELDERDSRMHADRSYASRMREASYDDNSCSDREDVPRVAFGGVDSAMSVPSKGSMRPTRSRVSTPYVSDAAVSQLDRTSGENASSDGRQSTVSFEQNVHVVKVPVSTDDTGNHIRSIRGRISTPFINDVNIAEDETAI